MTNNPATIERAKDAPAHTPTPWKAGHYFSIVGLPISAQPDPKKNTVILAGVCGERQEAEANATFIVKAVNSHDALVRALAQIAGGSFPGASDLAISGGWQPFVDRLQAIARDALASVDSRDVHAASFNEEERGSP